ncbi:MAG: glycosyltransferase [Thermodesulfobacteriota bacterium]
MPQPLVTIVIPTFNQGRYLPATVDHCLFQTYPNLEIILVDGGSTDGTKEYLAALAGKIASQQMEPVSHLDDNGEIIRTPIFSYPQNRDITILTFAEDIGATRTYNEGLQKATGRYCTYIVGDDLPHPHMIEEMVNVLESGKADFVYSDMNLVNDDGSIVRQMRLPDYDFGKCLADWFHLGVSKLYRTDLHDKAGLMDERYTAANDYDHYLRFAMTGCRFYHLPRVLYSVRWHGPARKTGQHTQSRYATLLTESKQCATRARKFLVFTQQHNDEK